MGHIAGPRAVTLGLEALEDAASVLIAIRDTSDALLSPGIAAEWRSELEAQLPELIDHLELVNRYVAARFGDDDEDLAGQPVAQSMVN